MVRCPLGDPTSSEKERQGDGTDYAFHFHMLDSLPGLSLTEVACIVSLFRASQLSAYGIIFYRWDYRKGETGYEVALSFLSLYNWGGLPALLAGINEIALINPSVRLFGRF